MNTHPFPDESNLIVRPIAHANAYDFSAVHRHDYYEIFLFERAVGGHQIIDFGQYPVQENGVYIVCPNQIHLLKRKPGEQGLLMQFTREFLLRATQQFNAEWLNTLGSHPHQALTAEEFTATLQNVKHLRALTESRVNTLKTQQVTHYFAYTIFHLLELLSGPHKAPEKGSMAIKFMALAEEQFHKERQVAYYANALNVSATTLRRQIKESLGKSPLEVLHSLLLLEIKRLLVVDELSHKEISFALHFDSPSTYNKFILKHTGSSPSQLKQRLIEMHKL